MLVLRAAAGFSLDEQNRAKRQHFGDHNSAVMRKQPNRFDNLT